MLVSMVKAPGLLPHLVAVARVQDIVGICSRAGNRRMDSAVVVVRRFIGNESSICARRVGALHQSRVSFTSLVIDNSRSICTSGIDTIAHIVSALVDTVSYVQVSGVRVIRSCNNRHTGTQNRRADQSGQKSDRKSVV